MAIRNKSSHKQDTTREKTIISGSDLKELAKLLKGIKYFVFGLLIFSITMATIFTIKYVNPDFYFVKIPVLVDSDSTFRIDIDDRSLNIILNRGDVMDLPLKKGMGANKYINDPRFIARFDTLLNGETKDNIDFYQIYLQQVRNPNNKFIFKLEEKDSSIYLYAVSKKPLTSREDVASFIQKFNEALVMTNEESTAEEKLTFVLTPNAVLLTERYQREELCRTESFRVKLAQNIFSAILISLFVSFLTAVGILALRAPKKAG